MYECVSRAPCLDIGRARSCCEGFSDLSVGVSDTRHSDIALHGYVVVGGFCLFAAGLKTDGKRGKSPATRTSRRKKERKVLYYDYCCQ